MANVNVYMDQGGDTLTVASGGTIDVESGGSVTYAGVGTTFTISLAASGTTDGMDITITAVDDNGDTVAAAHHLELWMSEDSGGIGLTADTYSGTLTASTGALLTTLTAKKHFTAVTAATGIFVGTLVDSANPTDQYVAVRKPAGDGLVISGASGTNWEGA